MKKQLSLKLQIMLLAMCMFTNSSFAQNKTAFVNTWHIDYSLKYGIGGGINFGYEINHNLIGIKTVVYHGLNRNTPASISASYGYSFGRIKPYILSGYYTSGNESVKNNEGISGIEYGGGIDVLLPEIKSKVGIRTTNVGLSFNIGAVIKI